MFSRHKKIHPTSITKVESRSIDGETEIEAKADNKDSFPFQEGGVSMRFLRSLYRLTLENSNWTTADVNKNLIKKWTAEDQCSLYELYDNKFRLQKHHETGLTADEAISPKANIFISHAWSYKFDDLVHAIAEFESNNKSDTQYFYWIDMFVNNQWHAPTLPHEWWTTTFASAIKKIGHTCVILFPWDKPITLTRVWYVYTSIALCTCTTK